MAKTMSDSDFANALPSPQRQKQGKKQAKREARLLLQLDEARETVQKNERKLRKAQQRLEESKTQLASLEARFSATHFPQHQLSESMPKTHLDGAQDQQSSEDAVTPHGEEDWRPAEIPAEEPRTQEPFRREDAGEEAVTWQAPDGSAD